MFLVREKGNKKRIYVHVFSFSSYKHAYRLPLGPHILSGGPMVETDLLRWLCTMLATSDAMPALEKCLCICSEWSSMGAR